MTTMADAPTSPRLPISATIITLNESTALPDCLASLDFVQDIVVIDSGSDDDTVALAESLGARVFHQTWLGYGQQKNVALQKARFDWVLCLDADERVDARLQQSIRHLFQPPPQPQSADVSPGATPPPCAGYRMARKNRFLGRDLRHGYGYPDKKIRLLDRRHGRWTEPAVHEEIRVEGTVGELEGDLRHLSGESLHDYLTKQNRYTTLQTAKLRRHTLPAIRRRLVFNPLLCFFKGYILKKGFLDGIPGLVHTVYHCFGTFMKYAKAYAEKSDPPTKGDAARTTLPKSEGIRGP